MDIATEEFSHLEIVGATIQMLLTGIDGDFKDAAESSEIMKLMKGKASKEEVIHQGMVAPQFLVGSAGGPCYTNSECSPGQRLISMGMHGRAHFRLTLRHEGRPGPKSSMNIYYNSQMIPM